MQLVALQQQDYVNDRISIASRLFYAPEVKSGEKNVTSVADVFSLGAILYLIVMFDFKIANFNIKQKTTQPGNHVNFDFSEPQWAKFSP